MYIQRLPEAIQQILFVETPNSRHVYTLTENRYTIERDREEVVVRPASGVSQPQATLIRRSAAEENTEEGFVILDGDGFGHSNPEGLLINGSRRVEHELQHGDIIFLDREVKVNYYLIHDRHHVFGTPETITRSLPQGTNANRISLPPVTFGNAPEDRFLSFVEFSPHPMIELDEWGNITYLNSIARFKFSELRALGALHPILQGLFDRQDRENRDIWIREVRVNGEFFEQQIHYSRDRRLARIYLFDITERVQIQEILHYQAFHDGLTSLPNRHYFQERLVIALQNAKSDGYAMAVLFLDLDGFKTINDTLGHKTGDRVLQLFVKRVRSRLRGGDLFCRWGGDEFTILLAKIGNNSEPSQLATRILDSLQSPFQIGEQQLYLRCSIGITIYPQDGEDGDTLLRNADLALYQTKQAGKNHYRFYRSSMNPGISDRLELETLLYGALDRQELQLHYQPQLNLRTGEVQGVEALLRCPHPELGFISPARLIPLAEETGLIGRLGEWVLQTACAQNRAWQDAGLSPVPIAVNLSPHQLKQPDFVDRVGEILAKTGLSPCWLQLEISEIGLMSHFEGTVTVLEQLSALGIGISLDNFGAGRTSLDSLKRIPFQTLKIARTFIEDLSQNSRDATILAAIITLSRGLQIRAIAEGVENHHQLQQLRELNCEAIQGYLFSYPLNPQEISAFLLEHQRM